MKTPNNYQQIIVKTAQQQNRINLFSISKQEKTNRKTIRDTSVRNTALVLTAEFIAMLRNYEKLKLLNMTKNLNSSTKNIKHKVNNLQNRTIQERKLLNSLKLLDFMQLLIKIKSIASLLLDVYNN